MTAAGLVVATGGKAGPGATTLAVGLAGAWAAAGRQVLLRPEAAMAVARAARQVAGVEVVVADAGRLGPGSVAQGLLALPDAVGVLAARADVPGALAAQRALLVAAEATATPLALVAVGVRRRMSADVAELAQALEHPVSGVIPAYRRQLGRAVQTGKPPTTGRLGRAYQTLATSPG